MATIRKTKAVEVRYANIRTVILHPRIRSNLTTNLLIYCPRIYLFSELMGHRAAEDDLGRPGSRLRFHLDRHADIKATLHPRGLLEDCTCVSVV
jgi:hypothetical protein